ncbi:MAG: molybdate ABC transporter substrate-binding protein [Acidobacteria bacterium]|nr:molybdate ABC transporter substrate-binding protein [Acidobacteriota bacterium]
MRIFPSSGHLLTSAVVAVVAPALLLTACSSTTPPATSGGGPGSAASGASPGQELSGGITVFAAASLKATFTSLADQFQHTHPGTRISFSFAGSSDLVTQITQGAPADVFASADTANMDKLVKASLVDGTPANFASNVLSIAVPPGNPANISSLQDLAKPGVKVVLCAVQVPCGAAAHKVEDATRTKISPVSEESNVTDVLGKVISGEADAGLVYATDVKGTGTKVKGIPFAAADKAVNHYPIATVNTTKNKALADAFDAFVQSDAGQKTLAAAGFGAP